ncbi:hypothetical protein M422DRAFT_240575 [Sphaerobolus stellatus SS14]|nr:hypothetical protein M422DRAFT_240575 [Sphaerobolus stellatus SS14]
MLAWTVVYLALVASTVSARPIGVYNQYRRATLDLGSCSSAEIIFANGLDGRTQPSFAPAANSGFSHGSALNIGVISSFICQQLNDKCKAPQATLDTCTQAQTAASKVTGGAAADAFNAAFGIQTNFATTVANGAVAADAATTNATTAAATQAAAADVGACPAAATAAAATAAAATIAAATTAAATAVDNNAAAATTASAAAATSAAASAAVSSALNFGTCTNPSIEFGPAFDGRKATEFSFEPADKTSINHGSALNINIITQATCDQLQNNCKAPQATLDACAKGQTAAAAATGGAAADAFNAALGITTNFATTPAAPGGGVATPAQALAANTPSFGTCSNPTISFGIFDGRTENSFEPANLADFNHSSALNPQIITQFICDTFVNKCNANQAAIQSCAAAQAAITGLSGQAVADAFNAAVVKAVSS